MTTYYPSIYKNSHVYSKLNSNSIVITTQSGFDDIVAETLAFTCTDRDAGKWHENTVCTDLRSTSCSFSPLSLCTE